MVDSAHATARGAAHGGSGEKAEDLLPRDEAEGRTIWSDGLVVMREKAV